MRNAKYDNIKKRINDAEPGTIFLTSDFRDIASAATVRQSLKRQVQEKTIRRILDGIYEKPVYSKLLQEFVPTDPEKVAHAIARGFRWTIAPSGDVALNKLGLSTQVPAVWVYISTGPYRKFSWDSVTISFKHRANRQITDMSELAVMVTEAITTLGKERIDDDVIQKLRKRLPQEKRIQIMEEASDVSEWVYEVIRKVCL